MGGCLDQPKSTKPKISNRPTRQPNRLSASRANLAGQKVRPQEPPKKYKKMTLNELLITYRIEATVEICSKMEGPKYLSRIVDGSAKILRILAPNQIDQKRLEIYKQIIGFQVYESDEGSLMLFDQYCSGEDFYEMMELYKQQKTQSVQKQLHRALNDVCSIIDQFHKRSIWLGNLNLSSFKKVSPFDPTLRLVDFNLTNAHLTDLQKMGFAHKQSYQADYQFVGYLIQFLLAPQPPIFIPHKITYVEFEVIPHSALIQKLLKGKKWSPTELSAIQPQQMINNQKMSLGYRLRRDINKLLKMRKKRRGHHRKFYGDDTRTLVSETKFNQDGMYRYESERVFMRISAYIGQVNSNHQEAFMNYASNNEHLRRLKEVFILVDGDKKLAQLKECLSVIK